MHEKESSLQIEKTWLQAQLEEENLRYELKERKLTREIASLENDIEEEKEVHSQITWYYETEMEVRSDPFRIYARPHTAQT